MSRVETPAPPASDGEITALRRELEDCRSAVAQLHSDLADVVSQSQENADGIDQLRQSLGG